MATVISVCSSIRVATNHAFTAPLGWLKCPKHFSQPTFPTPKHCYSVPESPVNARSFAGAISRAGSSNKPFLHCKSPELAGKASTSRCLCNSARSISSTLLLQQLFEVKHFGTFELGILSKPDVNRLSILDRRFIVRRRFNLIGHRD
jgi:hypothetical protein